ncbi:hypothetical protein NDL72_06440 [Neisseria gonorrhoeae]|uniref:hypothetical protein n=1 Tax=Neisseria gonorrhoeae TaxID=485 RepID=UPI0021E3A77E|nr:hypothetical protein [Neisseria gonorrhoeae]UXX20114.1 hypothetical protein NDL72_06440 [Neisseria gonorrhoeae]
MYCQVGNKCLEKHRPKTFISAVVPRIQENGQIIRPEYNGSMWKMSDGQPLRLSLAECSPKDNLQSGLETVRIVFGVLASVYFVSLLKKVLK